jgi:predicted nucleic acid-binding protein
MAVTSGRSFLDTNVLLYADDPGDAAKQRRAEDLFEELRLGGTGVVSTQVLQEYYSAATRRLKIAPERARDRAEIVARLQIVQTDTRLVFAAMDLSRLHRLNFWDALIVEAARAGGCVRLYSEDMQAGRRFGGVEVVNPFA